MRGLLFVWASLLLHDGCDLLELEAVVSDKLLDLFTGLFCCVSLHSLSERGDAALASEDDFPGCHVMPRLLNQCGRACQKVCV